MAWNMDKEKWIGAFVLGATIFWVADIDSKRSSATNASYVAPDITRLEGDLGLLTQKVGFLEISVRGLREFNAESALLDMDGKTYSSIDTSIGKLLVSVTEVKPTLNGFTLKLKVGNPNFMTLNDVDTTIYYGEPIQTLKIKLLSRLLPGRWNNAEITIAPATKEQIKQVGISFEPSNVQLGM